MIGAGSMGGMMSLLFAELGLNVSAYDPSDENAQALLNVVGDKTVENVRPYLEAGDIFLDASNENWLNTERRQAICNPLKVHYIGAGVSGGYQSARHGPSISPGGDNEGLDKIMPLLKRAAAKDSEGRACVAKVGPGGSGHYTKCVHNFIEQGLMSTLCEVWGIMTKCLELSYEEVGSIFEQWNSDGPLLTFAENKIQQTITPMSLRKSRIKLSKTLTKQGTGIWGTQEATRLHVPAPTIMSAHIFRIASADAAQRLNIQESLTKEFPVETIPFTSKKDKKTFIDDLQTATFAAFLMSFVQGLDLLSHASAENKWSIDFASIIQIWRAGCIIQSDHISDLLEQVYKNSPSETNLLINRSIAQTLSESFPALKRVVLKSIGANAHIPSLSASLEYIKYMGSTDLPTQFMEAELDYFGRHMFDFKSARPGKPVT
ncbi:hypothetical protein MMC14_001830, partial [Varicellaria rhodocarpa]|nr:hypothetical protein [Varicellaria rhodocarpa]